MANFMYVAAPRGTSDGFLSNAKQGWQDYTARYFNEGLSDVGDDDTLYIVGHGAVSGQSLQTLSASKLLEVLKIEKLPAKHKKFYLFSCYSGTKMPGAGKSFAEAFAYEIRDYFRSAKVIGYIGAVQFKRSGGDTTSVSTLAHFGDNGDNMIDQMAGKSAEVSFSVSRKLFGTNSVVADQAESYVGAVQECEEELSFMGDSITSRYQRIVVVDGTAAAGRARR